MATSVPNLPPYTASGDRSAAAHEKWLVDEMVARFRDIQAILFHWHGHGEDGVIYMGSTPSDSMKVEPADPADMTVVVNDGGAQASGNVSVLHAAETTDAFTAPSANPRKDLIQWNAATRAVEVKTGTEASSPAAPAVDAGCVSLAVITLQTSTASITASEIEDTRSPVNA